VTQHNGAIGVETELGRGTTFRIYLPAQGTGEAGAPQGETAAPDEDEERETILLVEDEERVRRLARRVLELLGYRALTAGDGQKALEVFRSAGKVALVIVDMAMPGIGGRDLMRELRTLDPELKGVIITGYALDEDIQALREEGIEDVIYKPFDVSTLEEVVHRALGDD